MDNALRNDLITLRRLILERDAITAQLKASSAAYLATKTPEQLAESAARIAASRARLAAR